MIESGSYAPWTKHDFKVAIRKFFKFVEWGHEALRRKDYPESVAGISIRVKKREQVRIQASDILTVEEIEQMITAAKTTQYRALVSLMYELGARVGEIGTMQVGSVSRDTYSYICDLNGKTGPRSVRAILSASALTNWLNHHPLKSDVNAPLWVVRSRGMWKQMQYVRFGQIVRMLKRRAGITKRVHPHLFRHSRITHLLSSGQMNEAQAKQYFGLVADSHALSTYTHLTLKDANDAVLEMHGIAAEKKTKILTPEICGMCEFNNERGSSFCTRCGQVLSHAASENLQARIDSAGSRVSNYFKDSENEAAFRRWIQEEIARELSRALPQQSSPPGEPTRARRAA